MIDDFVRRKGYLTLGTRLRRIGERLQAETRSVMADHGVPLQGNHYPVIAALDEHGPMTIGALAEVLGVSQPGVTRLVGQLAKLGMVRSRTGKDDARQKIVALTPAGQARVDEGRAEVWPLIQACVAEMLDGQRGPLLMQLDHLEDEIARRPFLARARAMTGRVADDDGRDGT
ncbi:MarR family transcriptional regulator [Limimaricola sp.]|uniref:MarR family winged helix-turn-helix transcriptional regulator n=1 Tax=Limimaricola sp. TaxID=2211665 RepID=UPI0025B998EA|nr:MarR family transcriptional regulator [Limimaricola sp.]